MNVSAHMPVGNPNKQISTALQRSAVGQVSVENRRTANRDVRKSFETPAEIEPTNTVVNLSLGPAAGCPGMTLPGGAYPRAPEGGRDPIGGPCPPKLGRIPNPILFGACM